MSGPDCRYEAISPWPNNAIYDCGKAAKRSSAAATRPINSANDPAWIIAFRVTEPVKHLPNPLLRDPGLTTRAGMNKLLAARKEIPAQIGIRRRIETEAVISRQQLTQRSRFGRGYTA